MMASTKNSPGRLMGSPGSPQVKIYRNHYLNSCAFVILLASKESNLCPTISIHRWIIISALIVFLNVHQVYLSIFNG